MSDDLESRIDTKAAELYGHLEAAGQLNLSAVLFHAAYAQVLLGDALQSAQQLREISNQLMKKLKESEAEAIDDLKRANEFADNNKKSLDELFQKMMPLAQKGEEWTGNQRNNGFMRHTENQKNHQNWVKWQADEKKSNPKFSEYSKQEQARRLKEKYKIAEKAPTIAKRLN